MSLQPSSNATTRSIVDPHPGNRHASNDPVHTVCGKGGVLEVLPREQKTIQEVAGKLFDPIQRIKEDGTALGRCNYNERPSSENDYRLRSHETTNIPLSPEPMDTLTSKFKLEKIFLDKWIKEEEQPGPRAIARLRIIGICSGGTASVSKNSGG